MFHHLTVKSSNVKTGKIPVSTSDMDTCPKSCQLRDACYASAGPLCLHWKKVSCGKNNATDWPTFTAKIDALPAGQVWRHNQAGDLRGANESICKKSLKELVKANEGKKGFTYTHYPLIVQQYGGNEPKKANKLCKANLEAVQRANENGFTVNASADNLIMAEKLVAMGIPVCSVVTEDMPIKGKTPNGASYIVCPAQITEGKTCAECKLCQKAKRKQIIAFQVHGTKKKHYKG